MNYRQVPIDVTPSKSVNKSRFNLSHEVKQLILPGKLTPVLCLPTLPGDDFTIDTEFLFNFNPLYYPIAHMIEMVCDYYYVPNRIMWPGRALELGNDGWSKYAGWQQWITEQNDVPHPYVDAPCQTMNVTITGASAPYNFAWEFRADQPLGPCLGLPSTFHDESSSVRFKGTIDKVNAFPFFAYWKIWNYYYRNEHLEPEIISEISLDNSYSPNEDVTGILSNQYVNNRNLFYLADAYWSRDYFTDATPTPQLGAAIKIPGGNVSWHDPDGSLAPAGNLQASGAVDPGTNVGGYGPVVMENDATIRELRFAEALQSYFERVVRIGQKYRDFIKGLWGNDPQPGVVDLPIMFGRKYGRIQISEQTATADTITGQGEEGRRVGDYVGRAFMYKSGEDTLKCYCAEHGWIMAILTIKPNTTYGQGIARWWRVEIPQDYPLDMFSHIGDQEIMNEELFYWSGVSEQAYNQGTFGYIPRFSEYKYTPNRVSGNLNYLYNNSRQWGRFWDNETFVNDHQELYTKILLDANFVKTINEGVQTGGPTGIIGGLRTKDVFRVMSDPSATLSNDVVAELPCLAHMLHSIYVNRNLPYYSTPDLT